MKNLKLYIVFAALLGSFLTLVGYKFLEADPVQIHQTGGGVERTRLTSLSSNTGTTLPTDFTYPAEQTLPKVVHIKISQKVKNQAFNPFGGQLPDGFQQFFQPFGNRQGGKAPEDLREEGSGSGVIISPDGYIVTNNHVAGDADEIEVSLYDKRTFKAKLIGKDPSTDLALIKIEAKDLPFIQLANSDELRVGQWVVAVGNPFNLESTVTAGIVSAKGRNININADKAPIEAFIQTDAAVNPGNSGGALVNMNGELVGINSAIASPTGSFAGYSFAVPSNLVDKVVADLRKYGVAQRAFLGARIRTVDGSFAQENKLDVTQGVWVDEVNDNSAAESAGLEKGDVITAINGVEVKESSALIEQIGRHRPGDKVTLTYLRNGKERSTEATLKNANGNTDEVTEETASIGLASLGADFKALSNNDLDRMNLSHGVQVDKLREGKLKKAGVKEGFVITRLNNQPVSSADDIERILDENDGNGLLIEGKYKGDNRMTYLGLGL
ncbi:MAG: Do family serine endopeptidase [Bacteroidetes bacterium]|nr:Do family serine endopeptidase [Bacteroidota bacterium]